MRLNSHNEWDPLREVIVGTADHMWTGLEFSTPGPVPEALIAQAAAIAKEARPDWYIEEVREDLAGVCAILTAYGATVHRPKGYGAERPYATPHWSATGKDLYNVRDLHLVVGDMVIVGPSASRTRYFEPDGLADIWYNYFEAGFRWIAAPKPRLIGEYRVPYYPPGQEGMTDEDVLHRQLSDGRGETFYKLLEQEILFDAAGSIRIGRDILYLISSSGNANGARWLQSVLGADYRVHTTTTYRSSHIDSTILPLRPGLVLLNSARVDERTCPAIFAKWDKLYFRDVAPLPGDELRFQRHVRDKAYRALADIGVESDLNQMSSPWAGLNVLSLDRQTILVHDRQETLIRELERRQFTVVPVRLRHCYTMLGGLHCSTLDTVRDGVLESYVD